MNIPESFAIALQHHQAGRLRQAEAIYQKILKARPTHADAWHLLGVIAHQSGQYDVAITRIDKAISINPNVADYHNNRGEACRVSGRLSEAVDCFERAVALKPDLVLTRINLGIVLQALGRLGEAIASFKAAITIKPDSAEAHYNLANAFELQGRNDEAIEHYKKAIAIRDGYAEAHYSLGNLFQIRKQLDQAVDCYQRALALQPIYPQALNNLGNALQAQGRLNEAIECYEKSLRYRPNNAMVQSNLGNVLQALGRWDEAVAYYRKALQTAPDIAEVYYNLGNTLLAQTMQDDAIENYKTAIALKPDYVDAYYNLGIALQEQGKLDEAEVYLRRAMELGSRDGIKVRLATMLPPIMQSNQEITDRRETFRSNLDSLRDQKIIINDPLTEVGTTNFYLAYHGVSDRDLQIKVAELYEQLCPSLLYTAPHCARPGRVGSKIKIGIISKYLFSHSIGKTTRGLIAELSRDRFHICAIFIPPYMDDDISRFIRDKSDAHLVLPFALEAARTKIAELELDVLFYQDIGMDPFAYYLAFSRLAPVQCVSFGHPDTTGIRNMDYFVSTEAYEPANGEEHYSEKLVRLRNVASCAYYYKPILPSPLQPRSYFGLDEGDHIYVCPQTLFKFHPEFDELLAGILRGDPDGRLVLIEGKQSYWAELLRQRFRKHMPDVLSRISFLPPQSRSDFINLIAVSDVMLDTIHFCGQNTTHEGLAAGTPVVTLPGEFHRGRHTLGFYQKMGMLDCVAKSKQDYINIALRLGMDPRYRSTIKQKILERRDVIWEESEVVREFERFFSDAVQACAGS